MNQAACPLCHSLAVTITDADEAKGTVTIHCLSCGKDSSIRGDAFDVDIGDLPVE